MTATVKLARCRCKPSHIDPTLCPEYGGTPPPTRVKLACPDGHDLIGTFEKIYGTAFADAYRSPAGRVTVEYAGETEVDWDSQSTVTRKGQRLWQCEKYDMFPQNRLVPAADQEMEATR